MTTVVSTVVDADPKFLMQAWNLALALNINGDITRPDVRFLVHHTPSVPSENLGILKRLGGEIVEIKPFGQGAAAYCNKLRQLESRAVREAEKIFLLDADILPLKPLVNEADFPGLVARTVDKASPPSGVLSAICEAAGFRYSKLEITSPKFEKAQTLKFNLNGGFYQFSKEALDEIASSWIKWAKFCLANKPILGNKLKHSDQLGLALALVETGVEISDLNEGHNFPTHFRRANYTGRPRQELRSIHYHSNVDTHGLPNGVGVGWIDRQIARFNRKVVEARRNDFDNTIFWDFRYKVHPELGSGVGSRGEVLAYKQERLAPVLRHFEAAQVLDIGCGDLEMMRGAKLDQYHGIDLSDEALSLARKRRPDWTFGKESFYELGADYAQLTICLDVLILQSSRSAFETLVRNLLKSTSQVLVVSGYEKQPPNQGIVYAHGSLSETLMSHPDVSRVLKIGRYHGAELLAVTKMGVDKPDLLATLDKLSLS